MKLPINYEKSHFSVKKLAREEYVKVQKGLCCHCKEPLTDDPSKEVLSKSIDRSLFPKRFFNWPVHLHHCHKTGMSIGAIHNKCNAYLWQYHGE